MRPTISVLRVPATALRGGAFVSAPERAVTAVVIVTFALTFPEAGLDLDDLRRIGAPLLALASGGPG
jgi:hypothetical protein